MLVDRSTLEVYADGGSRVLSANVFPFMNTTMSSAVGAGATFMPVQSTANFQVGQTLRVNADANGPLPGMTELTITAVGTSSLNFLPALATSRAAGTPVSTPLATGVEAFARRRHGDHHRCADLEHEIDLALTPTLALVDGDTAARR